MYANTPRSPDAICERFTMKDNVTELAAVHKVMRWNPASCLDVDMNSALTTGPVLDLFQVRFPRSSTARTHHVVV